MHHSEKKKVLRPVWLAPLLVLVGLILVVTGLVVYASNETLRLVAFLKQGEIESAKTISRRIQPLVRTFDVVTLGRCSDLEVWSTVLEVPQQIQTISQSSQLILTSFSAEDGIHSLIELSPQVRDLNHSLTTLLTLTPDTLIIKKQITSETLVQLDSASQVLGEVTTVLDTLSQGKQTWVIVFQNSNELRATGGFPGSYALVEFQDGKLAQYTVEDIYDADGQFNGYIPPPKGIAQYTSANKGLRLPDANWWPDFPTSAQTMLQFFALGDKNNITGVVTVNLETAQQLLAITGPLYLPDYGVEITATNVDEVLRAEREEFFPGSKQKKQLLAQALTQFKLALSELTTDQQLKLVMQLITAAKSKNIQVFSTTPTLQETIVKYPISGAIAVDNSTDPMLQQCDCEPTLLMLVESNVGINKVNRYIERLIEIDILPHTATVSAHFNNHAVPLTATELSALVSETSLEQRPRNGNGYLNYYRLLISPNYTIDSIKLGQNYVSQWDEEMITTSSGEQLLQIGVLMGVPEQSSTSITFSLSTKQEEVPPVLLIPHQSGLPDTKYTVHSPAMSQQFVLSKDTAITLE